MNYNKKQFKKDLSELMNKTNNKQELYNELVKKSYPSVIVADRLNSTIHKKDIEHNKLLFYSFFILLIADSIILFLMLYKYFSHSIITPIILVILALNTTLRKCISSLVIIYSILCTLLFANILILHTNDFFTFKTYICLFLIPVNIIISTLFQRKICKT